MAIQIQNYTLGNGLKSELAYVNIDYFEGNKEFVNIDVRFYVSKEAYDQGLPNMEQKTYSFIPDKSSESANYYKQGYNYLKTLADFENAKDI